ncbi:MAG TPA: hypothetical protein ENI05_07295 [Porticoccus sp.]|nr:hypothetical protein [Porticoccus sp.]
MRERIDTFQVGPMASGLVNQAIEDVIPAVRAEAEKTANGRTITVQATKTLEGNDSMAHVFIEHNGEELSEYDLTKTRTVVTEQYTCGVYDSPVLEA